MFLCLEIRSLVLIQVIILHCVKRRHRVCPCVCPCPCHWHTPIAPPACLYLPEAAPTNTNVAHTHTRTHRSFDPTRPSYSPLPNRMSVTAFFLLLLSWPLLVAVSLAHPNGRPPHPLAARANSRNVPPLGFYDPRDHNGSWLTVRFLPPIPPSLLEIESKRERMGGTRSQLVKRQN